MQVNTLFLTALCLLGLSQSACLRNYGFGAYACNGQDYSTYVLPCDTCTAVAYGWAKANCARERWQRFSGAQCAANQKNGSFIPFNTCDGFDIVLPVCSAKDMERVVDEKDFNKLSDEEWLRVIFPQEAPNQMRWYYPDN